MVRAGLNAHENLVLKIEVTGLGDYTRNIGYMTGSMAYECETKQLLKYELKQETLSQ